MSCCNSRLLGLALSLCLLLYSCGESESADSDVRQSGGCGYGDYQCNNGNCIAESLVNDGDNDCGDNSDESSPSGCDEGLFACDNGECVHPSRVDDGEDDCGDGSDESSTRYCQSGELCPTFLVADTFYQEYPFWRKSDFPNMTDVRALLVEGYWACLTTSTSYDDETLYEVDLERESSWSDMEQTAPGPVTGLAHRGRIIAVGNRLYEWDTDSESWEAYPHATEAPGEITAVGDRTGAPLIAIGNQVYYSASEDGWRKFGPEAPSTIVGLVRLPGTGEDKMRAAFENSNLVYRVEKDEWVPAENLHPAPAPIVALALDGYDVWIAVQRQ